MSFLPGMFPVGTIGSLSYIAQPIRFGDGLDYLTRGAGLTSAADSSMFTLSFWAWVQADSSYNNIICSSTTSGGSTKRFNIQRRGSAVGTSYRMGAHNSAGTGLLDAELGTVNQTASGWQHILISMDMTSTSKRWVYVNDVLDTTDYITYTSGTLDFTVGDWAIGAIPNGVDNLDGDIADVWFTPGVYLDLSVTANRRKFIDGNKRPIYLGATGELPTGTAPKIFLSGNVATWHTNDGTGGGFNKTGTLTNSATSPSVGYVIPESTDPFTYIASTTSEASTITAPSSIQSGDLLVMIDAAHGSGSSPTGVTPTGFTIVGSSISSGLQRLLVSYKIADGTESSTSITGMNGTAGSGPINQKVMLQYRSTLPLTQVSVSTPVTQATSGTPATQSVTASAVAGPVLGIAAYAEMLVGGVTSQASSRTQSHEITPNGSLQALIVRDFAQNYATPFTYTIGMADEGTNLMFGFYFHTPVFVPVVTYAFLAGTQTSTTTLGGTTYTFNSQPLGAADTNRIIVVGAGGYSEVDIGRISSITVAGISGSEITTLTDHSGGGFMRSSLWAAQVPTGTTGSIVVTFTGTPAFCGIGTYRMVGSAQLFPFATATDNTISGGNAVSALLDIPGQGVGIGFNQNLSSVSGAARTSAWTNLNEDVDLLIPNDTYVSMASSGVGGALTRTCTSSGGLSFDTLLMASWGPTVRVSALFLGSDVSTLNQSTYTFTSQPLGTVDSARRIIVGVGARIDVCNSVTIAGVSATKIVEDTTGGHASLWAAYVPTGTTGTIVVTLASSVQFGCGIAIWRLLNSAPSAASSASDGEQATAACSGSLTIPVNGTGIGYFSVNDGTGATPGANRTTTWTNLTEILDEDVETSGNQRMSHSGAVSTTAGTLTRTATASGSAAPFYSLALAAWGLPLVDMSFVSHGVSATDTSTFTFASQALGAADPTRCIVVAAGGYVNDDAEAYPKITSISVGGITGIQLSVADRRDDVSNDYDYASVWIARVPTGTTGNITITWDGPDTMQRCGFVAWRLVNANPNPSDVTYGTMWSESILDQPLTIPDYGCGLGYAYNQDVGGSARTFTWTNLTEQTDEIIEAGGYSSHTAAHSTTAGTLTRTVTLNGNNNALLLLQLAAFEPATEWPPNFDFIGWATWTTPGTSYHNFGNFNFGTGSCLAIVAVCQASDVGFAMAVAGVKIGGVAATINVQNVAMDGVSAAIASLVVAGGSLSVEVAGTTTEPDEMTVGVWVLRNYTSATPVTNRANSTSPDYIEVTNTVLAGGVAVTASAIGVRDIDVIWTGAVGRFEMTQDGGDAGGGASYRTSTLQTNRAFRTTWNTGHDDDNSCIVVASWK